MVDNRISNEDILKYLFDNDIINPTIVAQKIEMDIKERCLKKHTYKIWLANDGYWKTKLPKGVDGKSLRLVKKKNRSDVEEAVIEYYRNRESEDKTFKARFDIWIERQRICGRSGNTILKYESDYRRFFEGYPIENYYIQDITDEVLSEHILNILKEKEIRWRAFKDIMGYVNGVFEKAVKDKVVSENPCKYLDLPIYRRFCYLPPVKTTKERTLTDDDIHTLLEHIRNPKAKNVNHISCFAIEMALNTGMRVGELAALMWEDIILDENIMLIRRSEKFDKASKESIITITKTGKERVFPLTDDIKELLTRVKEFENKMGWYGDYIFQDAEGRLTKSKISDAMRNHTMSDEFSGIKSIHAIRRTFNSKLKCNGVSTTVASSLLGHTERVNESNYTYDVMDMDEKRKILEIVTQSNKNGMQESG